MQLSNQMFAEVVDSMKAMARDASGQEKRKTSRITVESKLLISPLKDGKWTQVLNACSRDLSVTGVGILIAQPLERGGQMIAHLPRKGGQMIPVVCNIKFSRSPGDNLFVIGAEFERIIDQAEVEASQHSSSDLEARITQSILG